MLLSEDYIVSKFYQYAGYVKYNRLSKAYCGGCPSCREGKSWGKKRRLYYVTKKNLIFCHNCGLSVRPVKWIQQVAGLTYTEILRENNTFATPIESIIEKTTPAPVPKSTETLPADAINLSDSQQVNFYRNEPAVMKAISVLKERKLDVAINRPATFWISLNDPLHKNRLIIPFYDTNNKIVHYQTRTILEGKHTRLPKYLSKLNSEKTLFGVNQINDKSKYIFITEGPLDACFITNGIAVAGINESRGHLFTKKQQEQLNQFATFEQIWVLDNQCTDRASYNKTNALIKMGCKVFIWPKELKKYKDLNDLCVGQNLNAVPEKFILKNSFSGLKAKMLLTNQISQSHR